MKKIRLFFLSLLSMIAWTGVLAQSESEAAQIDAANAAIENAGVYRIYTLFDGSEIGTTKYYLKADGYLTDNVENAKAFSFTRAEGGTYAKGKGYKLNQFTNGGDGGNNITSDAQKHIVVSGSNNRDDFEGQVFFLNDEGNYAIRSTNSNSGSWAASAFWTVVEDNDEDELPNATYTMSGAQFIWKLEYDQDASLIPVYNYTLANAQALVDEALDVVDYSKPYIKNVNESNDPEESQLWSNALETKEGSLGNLIDDNKNTFFHSAWSYSIEETHALFADLGEPVEEFVFTFSPRQSSYNDFPAEIVIYGSNDVSNWEDAATWTEVEHLTDGFPTNYDQDYTSPFIEMETAYRYFKFEVPKSYSQRGVYFNLSEFQVYPFDPSISQYFTVDGMKDLVDGLQKLIDGQTGASWDAINELKEAMKAVEDLAFIDVTYSIIFDGEKVAEMVVNTKNGGPAILPNELKRDFCTYSDPEPAKVNTNATEVTVTATWAGPFEISPDFENAHWYNMAVRKNWYVTSDNLNAEGALKTIEENAKGLKSDAYQWAFVGDPWHFQILNKAEGKTKAYAWVDASNAIPKFIDASIGNYWTIVKGTNITNSFMMTIPETQYRQVNQNGGAGGPLKLWTANTTSDEGSAFTVFDVPTDFAKYTGAIEEVMKSDVTGYFTLKETAKALWDDAYKTSCTYEKYVELQEAIDDKTNWILPETGYYILKNKNYGTYMGIDPTDANLYGNYETAASVKQIVKLEKVGDVTYKIKLEGKYAPVKVEQSQPVKASDEAGTYTLVIPAVGYGAFQANTDTLHSALHCRAAGDLVGWVASADASMWTAIDAKEITLSLNAAGEQSYATAYLPFGVKLGGDVKAYAIKLETNAEGDWAVPTAYGQEVAAQTPVLLVSESGAESVVATIDDAIPATNLYNALKGTLEGGKGLSAYVLNKVEDVVGFYALDADGKLAPNKAYLPKAAEDGSEVKLLNFDFATAIKSLNAAENNTAIFNLAGQRVSKARKGVFIKEGKKVVK